MNQARPVFLKAGKLYLDPEGRFCIERPNRKIFTELFSSAEHKSCWDCDYLRVAGFPCRFCAYWYNEDETHRPSIWSGDAENEFKEMGRTNADECCHFTLAPEMAGLPLRRNLYEAVNPPDHYQGKVECIDAVHSALGDEGIVAFCKGNAMKYIYRAGKKEGKELEDLRKVFWYLDYAMRVYKFPIS